MDGENEKGDTVMNTVAWTVTQWDVWTILFCGAFVLLIWLLVTTFLSRER